MGHLAAGTDQTGGRWISRPGVPAPRVRTAEEEDAARRKRKAEKEARKRARRP